MTEPTPAEYAAAQAAEYGQYVALYPIEFDGARAYNPGQAVPASNVDKYGYLDGGLVERVNTPAPQYVDVDTFDTGSTDNPTVDIQES